MEINPSYKQMTQTSVKLAFASLIGAALAGMGTGVYFLHQSNDALEQRRDELQVQVNTLMGEKERIQAENIRLQSPTTLPR